MLMPGGATRILGIPALLLGIALISACENDINKIKEISAKQSTNPIQETTGVDVIYSDSAKVKAHMTAPLLLQLNDPKYPDKAFDMMPKGVKVVFYDTTRQESGNIVADSAINHTKAQIIEFHKNVVATNAKGDKYQSDELIWDQAKRIIYSNKQVQLTTTDGNVMTGSPFTSDEKLTHPNLKGGHGTIIVSEMPGKP